MGAVLDIGWEALERDVDALAACLVRAAPAAGFDRLVLVARGALVPGGLLAGRLDVERVETVEVRSYDGRAALPEARLLGERPAAAGPSGDPSRTLVLDELLESGRTLALLGGLLPQAARAVLLVKGTLAEGSEAAPGRVRCAALRGAAGGEHAWAARVVPADRWVVFPWTPTTEAAGRTAATRGT